MSDRRILAALAASGGRLIVVGGVAVVLRMNNELAGESHREEQRRAWLQLSYAERLRWLDEAKRFARAALTAARRRRSNQTRG
jgi:hypothetical protein